MKANKVKKLTIVSLSRGIIGEHFVAHEIAIGERRLQEWGIDVNYAPHAMSGLDYVANHPEDRAKDLLEAFGSDTDMILCAIGGDETYRLLPYLFDNDELKKAVTDKIFLGFSDTTFNHFMLRKVGLKTFYGQAFFSDVCDIAPTMAPYSEKYLRELLETGTIREITPSDVWYDSREDFSVAAVGTTMPSHPNAGFVLLQGAPVFTGEIFGGCLDSIWDMFNNERYADTVTQCNKYNLFPTPDEWCGKILLLETSEEKATPEKYRNMITALKDAGVFDAVNGVLLGKPADEYNDAEYRKIIVDVIGNKDLPIVANINIGHATPRCIIPFGVPATVDVYAQKITFHN